MLHIPYWEFHMGKRGGCSFKQLLQVMLSDWTIDTDVDTDVDVDTDINIDCLVLAKRTHS